MHSSTNRSVLFFVLGLGLSCLPGLAVSSLDRVSARPDAQPASDVFGAPTISADGRFVVFDAEAYLAEGAPAVDGTQPRRNLYLRDLVSGELMLLSWNRRGDDTPNGVSEFPSIDAGGQRIVFASSASDLVDGPVAGPTQNAYLLSRTGGLGSASARRCGDRRCRRRVLLHDADQHLRSVLTPGPESSRGRTAELPSGHGLCCRRDSGSA